MAVTPDDVRHIAGLARLGLDDARIPAMVEQLNGILAHMDALTKVNTVGAVPAAGVGASGMPLRVDAGGPVPLARALELFAPAVRDGLLLVPRLDTHVDGEAVENSVEAES